MSRRIKRKEHVKYVDHKGRLHRVDGPARIYNNGTKQWYYKDKLHRKDGPALEYNDGRKAWYINGKRHREDGPAVISRTGSKTWWLDDVPLTKEEYNNRIKLSKRSETIKKVLGHE